MLLKIIENPKPLYDLYIFFFQFFLSKESISPLWSEAQSLTAAPLCWKRKHASNSKNSVSGKQSFPSSPIYFRWLILHLLDVLWLTALFDMSLWWKMICLSSDPWGGQRGRNWSPLGKFGEPWGFVSLSQAKWVDADRKDLIGRKKAGWGQWNLFPLAGCVLYSLCVTLSE